VGLVALTVGMVGAGLAATFTDSGVATERIDIGIMSIRLASDNGTVNAEGTQVTCPAVFVDNAYGNGFTGTEVPPCNVRVVSDGSITPSQVDVVMQAETDGAHLERFGVAPTGFPTGPGHTEAGFFWLSASEQTIGHFFGNELPGSLSLRLDWGEGAGAVSLDNDDMGRWIVVTYEIEAFS
jgi:hypothetical protein